MKKDFKELVKEELKMRLEDYEGATMYGCDMSYELLEKYNIDGSYTYSAYESKELIKQYFDDFAEIYEEYLFQCGKENAINCFDEPEKFVVVMLLETASSLLSQCELIDTNWNEEIELTEENIKTITKQLEELEAE